jgi:hypothetical protein
MYTRGSFPGENRPGREADHSHPSSAEVNNAWSYLEERGEGNLLQKYFYTGISRVSHVTGRTEPTLQCSKMISDPVYHMLEKTTQCGAS